MVDVPNENQSADETTEANPAVNEPPSATPAAEAPRADSKEAAAEQARRASTIAAELKLKEPGVARALALFDAGYAVPFVAQYRREETGNLNEPQLESVYEAYLVYRSLADRRKAILQTLRERGLLGDQLRQAIEACRDKIELEDLYLPLKRRERTKATAAVDQGLGPLADLILDPDQNDKPLEELAAPFVRPEKKVNSAQEALAGAREILCETFAQDAGLRRELRSRILADGVLAIHPTKSTEPGADRYKGFYDTTESLSKIPPQRFLQIMRGVRTGALRTVLQIDDAAVFDALVSKAIPAGDSPAIKMLRECLRAAYDQTMRAAAERDAMAIMQERSDAGAIRAFRETARNRLMTPPAGALPVLGVAAHQRDAISWAAIDAAGEPLGGGTVAVGAGDDLAAVRDVLAQAIEAHEIRAIAIGRGDRSGDVLRAAREILGDKPVETCYCTIVQEAGHPAAAQVTAGADDDPGVAAAAIVARQHQDPLRELAKLDPRHIGIGQNFHEVNQKRLRDALQRTIMSCVCRVGLNLNEASVAMLGHVCGIQPATAENIAKRRSEEGPFTSRRQLLDVAGVGPKVFEQAAPFLRIDDGEHPLDALAIHPDHYAPIEAAAAQAKVEMKALREDEAACEQVVEALTASGTLEVTTLHSVRHILKRSRRDPRGRYRPPKFNAAVRSVAELEPGAVMEGVVTNVADFGAFVEVGVGQDGLVHLSELANGFVRDPRQIVSVGQTVTVKVLQVDKDKPRISLSIKALQPAKPRRARHTSEGGKKPGEAQAAREDRQPSRERDAKRSAPQRSRKSEKSDHRRSKDRPQRSQKRKGAGLPEHDDQPLKNTMLADQLEALKDRLGA